MQFLTLSSFWLPEFPRRLPRRDCRFLFKLLRDRYKRLSVKDSDQNWDHRQCKKKDLLGVKQQQQVVTVEG